MKLVYGIALGLPACVVAFACAPAEEAASSSELDAGADVQESRSPAPDVASRDGAAREPEPFDAGRVELACEEEPCYVAVTGNRSRHFCGLLRDGTVRCWGRDTLSPAVTFADGGTANADGALGRGTPVSAVEGAVPAPVLGLSNVTQLSVGPNLGTCARTSDGAVYCWGRNEFGQLGRSPSEAQLPVPTRVEGLPPVDEVQLGFQTGCAIGSADRALYCWGKRNAFLPTYYPPELQPQFRPPLRALTIGTWVEADTIIALLDGNVLANQGPIVTGETSLKTPTAPVELAGVTQIGAFAYVAQSGTAWRWGPSVTLAKTADAVRLTGPLYFPSRAGVVDIKISDTNAMDLSRLDPRLDPYRVKDDQGGALLADGRLFRWGLNSGGTIGVPVEELVGSRTPAEVVQVSGQVISFAIGVASTCASLVSGKVKCWGANRYGELGRGTVDLVAHPDAEVIR